ncbi:Threonylcarbamoyl AMP synthase [Pandoravirus quercus]|uniref:N(6)-L-threonylcarbamoyladenine synthase n=1 Tax=Pandoravirus quercus TaxID=2107709 RepID=A0A2U7UAS7_9VIRU|nr:Threonylcarbamoyl AMP synthase [Pandoravirus quercus]AVK75502.1 Threonylcarbamoyl AMP synthase [Pandoravirus quercus]
MSSSSNCRQLQSKCMPDGAGSMGTASVSSGMCATGVQFERRVTVLGIESSCDDTGVAVLQVGGGAPPAVLAHEVATSWGHHAHQADIDKEHAAAVHREAVGPLVARVVAASGADWDAIDSIAVTVGPGMMGGLMAGVDEAVRLAALHNKPLVPTHHLEGHALVAGVCARQLCFPFLVLLASGGSCQLVLAYDLGDYRRLGQTLDCAPGQALDAVARALALDLDAAGSGGRAIELAAKNAHVTNAVICDDAWPNGCDFSFAGLRDRAAALARERPADEASAIAAAVQAEIVDQLVSRTAHAFKWCRTHALAPTALVVAGGVGANALLRERLQHAIGSSASLVCPPPWLCTDNGVMIAHAGALHYLRRPDAFVARPTHVCLQHEWHLGEDVSEYVKANRAMARPAARALIGRDVGDAARALQRGQLVAFPTETVYGLGADATSDEAARRIFEVKGRPTNNPIIVHVASKEQFYRIAGEDLDVTLRERCERLMDEFWPGPLTLLVPNGGQKLSPLVTCGLPVVGLRMPDNATAIDLIQRADVGVAAPSANRSGRPSPTCAEHVAADLAGQDIWGVLDGGGSTYGIESTVLDVATLSIYREGPITAADISRALGGVPVDVSSGRKKLSPGEAPKAPGMLYRHYAPDTDVTVVHGTLGFLNATVRSMRARGLRVGVIASHGDAIDARASKVWYCMRQGKADAMGSLGANLYAALRGLDLPDVDIILVRAVPESCTGGAIMERLGKASQGSRIVEPPVTARLQSMVGADIVQRIAQGRVLVCGLGGAGAPLVDMAVRAGIRRIGLLDPDRVELSNLIRMPQATLADVDRRKIDVVAERARAVNPNVDLTLLAHRITLDFDMGLLRAHEYDIIVDAVDDPDGKVALIKYAVENGIPLISCMGAGNKTDVTQTHRIVDIADAGTCLLGLEIKRLLAREGITRGVKCAVTEADHWILAPQDGRNVIGNWPPCYFMASAVLLDHVLRVLAGPESVEDRVRDRAVGVSTRNGTVTFQ